jgi:hypothetical protein
VARIWTEAYRSGKHFAPWEYRGSVDDHLRAPSLIPKNVLLVSVASFTFQFFTVQQLRDCLEYFSRKTHPSSRLDIGSADHWEALRWFEQLPMYLLEEPKRLKVISALSEALRLTEQGEFPVLSQPRHIRKRQLS